MELVIFIAVCLFVGALYGKRAPDDAKTHHGYQVEPAKRGVMHLGTFAFMTVLTVVSAVVFMMLFIAVATAAMELR